jgi:hypothetical protein
MAKTTAGIKIINDILSDKMLKVKNKVSSISDLLLSSKIKIKELVEQAKKENDVNKATLIEAMEHASKTNPAIIDEKGFQFAIDCLAAEAPRVKWESARLIANTAHLFPKMHKKAIVHLLDNTVHSGMVVRWSAATALSKIIQCKTALNKELIPAIQAIEKRETDNAIKKIYQQGLKKAIK